MPMVFTNTVVHSGEAARCKEAIPEGTNRGAAVEGLPYQLQSTLQQCLGRAAELQQYCLVLTLYLQIYSSTPSSRREFEHNYLAMQRIIRTTSRHPVSLLQALCSPIDPPIRHPSASREQVSPQNAVKSMIFLQNKNPGLIGVPFPCFACTTVDQFRQQMPQTEVGTAELVFSSESLCLRT